MPYIPKQPLRLSPTTRIPPELAIPQRTPSQNSRGPAPPQKAAVRVGLPTISPLNYKVDVDKVISQLFGRELQFDETTGVCNYYERTEPRNMVPAAIPTHTVTR